MAIQDQFGNYQPNLNSRCFRTDIGAAIIAHGQGAPSSGPFTWQREYVNDLNGDIYLNVSNAWVKQ